jgi:hypothetical protein
MARLMSRQFVAKRGGDFGGRLAGGGGVVLVRRCWLGWCTWAWVLR